MIKNFTIDRGTNWSLNLTTDQGDNVPESWLGRDVAFAVVDPDGVRTNLMTHVVKTSTQAIINVPRTVTNTWKFRKGTYTVAYTEAGTTEVVLSGALYIRDVSVE